MNIFVLFLFFFGPSRPPLIIVIILTIQEKVNELRDQASLLWLSLGDKHRRWCCQWIRTYTNERDLIRLGNPVCVSIETNCHHHHYWQTGIDLNKWNFRVLTNVFVWKTRRCFRFFFSVCPARLKSIFTYCLY